MKGVAKLATFAPLHFGRGDGLGFAVSKLYRLRIGVAVHRHDLTVLGRATLPPGREPQGIRVGYLGSVSIGPGFVVGYVV